MTFNFHNTDTQTSFLLNFQSKHLGYIHVHVKVIFGDTEVRLAVLVVTGHTHKQDSIVLFCKDK